MHDASRQRVTADLLCFYLPLGGAVMCLSSTGIKRQTAQLEMILFLVLILELCQCMCARATVSNSNMFMMSYNIGHFSSVFSQN